MSVAHLAMGHVSDPVTEQKTGLRELTDGTLMSVLSANRKKWLEAGQLAVRPACPSITRNQRQVASFDGGSSPGYSPFETHALDLSRQTITA
jgi:hypothetical protein